MFRQSLQRELAAAAAVAAKAGFGRVAPELLHLGNHTSVRLAPLPIVARIASGTSFDFSPPALAREVAIGRHLASAGAPAVRPVIEPNPGPYLEDECAITLWQFVDGRPAATRAEEAMAGESLQLVHKTLADIEVELPSFVAKIDSCDAILSSPVEAAGLAPSDRLFLQRLYSDLRNELERIGGKWQPLHGDSHIGNVRITEAGAIWMDLESACLGPREWDIGALPERLWPSFGEIDTPLMRLLSDVRSLCVAVWCWAEFDRSPQSAEAALYHLDVLKHRFGWCGGRRPKAPRSLPQR